MSHRVAVFRSGPLRWALIAAVWGGVAVIWARSAAPPGPHRLIFFLGRWSMADFARNVVCTAAAVCASLLLACRTKAHLLNVAVAFAATGLCVALLEVPAVVGWVDYGDLVGIPEPDRLARLKPWENPGNLRDPELLFRRRPGLRFRGRASGDLVDLYGIATDRRYDVDVSYDRSGFRNPTDRTSAEIALIGDSFVEAALVPDSSILGARLERLTGRATVTLGTSGYGPQQELVVLRRYAMPLRPAEVVLAFFEGNDLLDAYRYENARASYGAFGASADSALEDVTTFRSRSLTWNALRSVAVMTQPRPREDGPSARGRSCVLDGGERLYFAYEERSLEPNELEGLEITFDVIRDARRAAEGGGARFLLLFVPVKFRVYEGRCVESGEIVAGWASNDLPERMRSFAETEGIDFLDLTPPLRAAAAKGRLLYFQDDGHWNAAGIDIAARAVADRLIR